MIWAILGGILLLAEICIYFLSPYYVLLRKQRKRIKAQYGKKKWRISSFLVVSCLLDALFILMIMVEML